MKITTSLMLIIFVGFIAPTVANAQNCTCTEVIYLNETTFGGSVHKYTIDPTDGSLTEVLTNGGPWYPGAGTSEMSSPHGLGVDLNGLLYIGEALGGDIRQLDCKGNIEPATEYLIDRGGI